MLDKKLSESVRAGWGVGSSIQVVALKFPSSNDNPFHKMNLSHGLGHALHALLLINNWTDLHNKNGEQVGEWGLVKKCYLLAKFHNRYKVYIYLFSVSQRDFNQFIHNRHSHRRPASCPNASNGWCVQRSHKLL